MDLQLERRRCFLDAAMLDLDHVRFGSSLSECPEDRIEGFLFRLPIIAAINRREFDQANRSPSPTVPGATPQDVSRRLPRLSLPVQTRVTCIYGRHRITLARDCLPNGERWWPADLYADDLNDDLRAQLARHSSSEQHLNGGEVLYHMLLHRHTNPSANLDPWMASLASDDQRKEIRTVMSRPRLLAGFESLLPIAALWPAVLPSVLGIIQRLWMDEEFERGARKVVDFWMWLVDGDRERLRQLDARTPKLLGGRNPAISPADRREVQQLVERGEVFSAFSAQERRELWQRLLTFRAYLVPSTETLFDDVKYLRQLGMCLKRLVPAGKRRTLSQRYHSAFVPPECQDEGNNSSSDAGPSGSREKAFQMAYHRIVIMIMRHLEALRPGSVRLEVHERRRTGLEDCARWREIAMHAQQLGFDSRQITTLLSLPCSHTQHEAVPRADELVLPEEAGGLGRLEREETRVRRSGRPFRRTQQALERKLTLNELRAKEVVDKNHPISVLYVARARFHMFFGGNSIICGTARDDIEELDFPNPEHNLPWREQRYHPNYRSIRTTCNSRSDMTQEMNSNLQERAATLNSCRHRSRDRAHSHSLSMSDYSPTTSIPTDLSVRSRSAVERMQSYGEPSLLTCIRVDRTGQRSILCDLVIIDEADNDVSKTIESLRRAGLIPVTPDGRILSATQCISFARAHNGMIEFITVEDI